MNNYKKGKLLENLAEKKLKEMGFKIYFKSIRIKFQAVDFAGLFDLVAVKDKQWYFIQIKSRFDKKQWLQIVDWSLREAPPNSVCEMWIWNPYFESFDTHST
jgi:Holliday junction resolvase-like predicted endonuclease